jgi:pyrroline-5-carboxylate reductase
VIQTVLGAATMAAQPGADPAALRQQVTSPGGTTAAALGVFAEGDLPGLVARAMTAARDRGRELGA